MHDPERKGLPSASEMERIHLCPGSYRLSRECMVKGRSSAEDRMADEGTDAHSELESGEIVTDIAALCRRDHLKAMRLIRSMSDGPRRFRSIKEKRLWYKVDGVEIFSGKPDWIGIDRDAHEAVVEDYKTLRGEHWESASNMQLRSLAVLVAANYPVSRIHVVRNQPLAGAPDICTYEPSDLIESRDQILKIIKEARRPDAALNHGPKQCRWCPARFDCPAVGKVMVKTAMVDMNILPTLSGDQLGRLLRSWKTVKPIGDALEKLVKDRLNEDPASVPGYTLVPTGHMTRFKDIKAVYAELYNAGVVQTPDEFLGLCSLKKGDMEALIKSKCNGRKRRIDAIMNGLEPLMEKHTKQPSVKEERP